MLHWWRGWRSREAGVSVPALFILSLPLLLGAFGYALDSLRVAHLGEVLNSRADQAASTGTQVNYSEGIKVFLGSPPTGVLGANPDTAVEAAYGNYVDNTASRRGPGKALSCATISYVKTNVDLSGTRSQVEDKWRAFLASHNSPCTFYAQIAGNPQEGQNLCTPTASSRNEYGIVIGMNETVPMTFLKLLNIAETQIRGVEGISFIRANDTC